MSAAGDQPLILETDQLVAGYVPEVDILSGVSIKVRDGEIVTIVGPNGAGKSTLIKILAGFQPADQGALWVKGKDYKPHTVDDARKLGVDCGSRTWRSSTSSASTRTCSSNGRSPPARWASSTTGR